MDEEREGWKLVTEDGVTGWRPKTSTYQIAGCLDDDLARLMFSGELSLPVALQVQAVRELKRLREDVQHAAREAWLDGGEGRSA